MTRMVVKAPFVAHKAEPGQFIILRVNENGERIPLTIADYDREDGTVTIIYQIVGKTTYILDKLEVGDSISDFIGPLGKASELKGYKKAAIIGGGAGCAIAYPQAKALHNMGAYVETIAGFRNKDLIILESEMEAISDKLFVMTDDGSNGNQGFVTKALEDRLEAGIDFDIVIAIGPLPMMKAVCELTRKYNVKTIVSMNTIMIDGTGMCGGCRLKVDGKTKFACVDGPDFDGHQVDFDEAMKRLGTYRSQEKHSYDEACNLLNKKVERNMQQEKTKMPELEPEVRNKNFEEVALGYTPEMAINEARRCLNCKNKPCVSGCPVNVKIPQFIEQVANGNFDAAAKLITTNNSLPAICGRVCPQETQCEAKCVRGIKGQPVAIGNLERFVADYSMKHRSENEDESLTSNGHKVAVIGSGPSGLTCAADLAKLGYEVTIFEALHEKGGVLIYGIPSFRLPKDILKKEVESLKKLGVKIETNMVIGKVLTIDELISMGYEAIFVGTGAGLPKFMNIEGENLVGVYSANEFLTRLNLMKAYDDNYDTTIIKPKNAVVFGGGNVAMDSARSAKRLGAEHVYVVYRRSEAEMPARLEEVKHAKEEGIEFMFLNNPTKIGSNDGIHVSNVECVKMELGEPDESGRRRPVEIQGSNFTIEADVVIVAIGNSPNPLIKNTTKEIEANERGCLIVDEKTAQTTMTGVYAGGDAVTGAATVILAMGAGKKAAKSIDEYIRCK